MQWLFRTEPINDEIRLAKLEASLHEINHSFREFIREGIVGEIGTFPYTVPFGIAVTERIANVSGWITYFNLVEQENIKHLPTGQWLIGLRPLAAGRVFSLFNQWLEAALNDWLDTPHLNRTESIINLCLSYCLMHRDVKTNVLSINSMEQAKSLKKIMSFVRPVEDEKLKTVERLTTGV